MQMLLVSSETSMPASWVISVPPLAAAHVGRLEEQPVMATRATSRPDYGI
jgi:hypothetical protein